MLRLIGDEQRPGEGPHLASIALVKKETKQKTEHGKTLGWNIAHSGAVLFSLRHHVKLYVHPIPRQLRLAVVPAASR